MAQLPTPSVQVPGLLGRGRDGQEAGSTLGFSVLKSPS